MKLTIDRAKWARAGINGESYLLNSEGSMRCLGFLAKECGIKDEELLKIPAPGLLARKVLDLENKYFSLLVALHPDYGLCNNDFAVKLMKTNDNTDLLEEDREGLLTEEFKNIGIEVQFV